MLKTTIPTIEIKTTGIDLSAVQTIEITIKQRGGYTVAKGNDDIEVDNDIMSVSLSQSQYTKLKEGDFSVSISATTYEGVTQKVKLSWAKFGSRTSYEGGSGGGVEYDILPTVEAVETNTEAGKLVDALAIKEVFQSVSDGKSLIASAITDKGIKTDAEDTFSTMANNIGMIETGGGGTSGGALKVQKINVYNSSYNSNKTVDIKKYSNNYQDLELNKNLFFVQTGVYFSSSPTTFSGSGWKNVPNFLHGSISYANTTGILTIKSASNMGFDGYLYIVEIE